MDILGGIKRKLTSFRIIILGFAGLILVGALLLMLPIATKDNIVTPFNETFFTATSAVCVTGLVVQDTATYWSSFGQGVILFLIQIGGLGVVTVMSLVAMLAGKKISLKQRQTIQNSISAPQIGGLVKMIKFIFRTAIIIELIGAFALMPFFCKEYGLEGIWMSFFHSISGFCNAGFDLMGSKSGKFSSLTAYDSNVYITIVISMIIVMGGIGFATWKDIVTKKHHIRKYSMQSKVILVTSFILLVLPMIFFFLVDFADMDLKERICKSIFQSVTTRTAGFNTADFSKMTGQGLGIMMFLMLVGGSPGSTAGGMKTTTLAVLFASANAVVKKRNNAVFFGRRIPDTIVKNASAILFLYVTLAVSGAIIISTIENVSMSKCLFETVSAVGTVGLSMSLTPTLGVISQVIIAFLMFFGRVGGLTIIYATFSHRDSNISKFPEENIMVG